MILPNKISSETSSIYLQLTCFKTYTIIKTKQGNLMKAQPLSNGTEPVRSILVVDDHIIFREGLASLFESSKDFHVVGQAGSVQESISLAFELKPDIILMDFSLPDGNGLDAAREILRQLPACKIIFLTIYETDANLLEAIRIGAKGFLLKNISSVSLLASLRGLDQGELAMSRKMMSHALESSHGGATSADASSPLDRLSPRELDILRELQKGSSNKEIARRLVLSENTVKHHIHNILDKLGTENRRAAGILARKLGLPDKKTSPGE